MNLRHVVLLTAFAALAAACGKGDVDTPAPTEVAPVEAPRDEAPATPAPEASAKATPTAKDKPAAPASDLDNLSNAEKMELIEAIAKVAEEEGGSEADGPVHCIALKDCCNGLADKGLVSAEVCKQFGQILMASKLAKPEARTQMNDKCKAMLPGLRKVASAETEGALPAACGTD